MNFDDRDNYHPLYFNHEMCKKIDMLHDIEKWAEAAGIDRHDWSMRFYYVGGTMYKISFRYQEDLLAARLAFGGDLTG